MARVSWACAVRAVGGARPSGGGGGGVLVACGTKAPVGTVARAGGGGCVFLVHLIVWCSAVRRVGWVACVVRLCWVVVVMELVGVAAVLGHQGVGVGGGRGVLMLLLVPRSLALRQWPALCGVDLCRQQSLAGPPSLRRRSTAVVGGHCGACWCWCVPVHWN